MAEALKDRLHHHFFQQFIQIVRSATNKFDAQQFLHYIYDQQWPEKELKQRIRHVAKAVRATFPEPYEQALDILLQIAPQCRGMEYLFFPDFVEMYGLEDWELSMQALKRFTASSTSEFAVRAFIVKDQEKMMAQMLQWTQDNDHHVRRLASEGCRPRLPWGQVLKALKENPAPIFPILENLKQDESLYVRKSVANNLNDISKDHPERVKQLAYQWAGSHPYTDWIIKHGSRTLLKKGDKEALRLFGYHDPEHIHITGFSLSQEEIELGEELVFTFDLLNQSNRPQPVRIEYAIDYMKANGKQSRKIFQLTQKSFPEGRTVIRKKHGIKDLSTRKHYPGMHGIRVIVNGVEKASGQFKVRVKGETE